MKSKKIIWITINEFYMKIDCLLIKKLIKEWYDVSCTVNNNNIYKFYKKNNIPVTNLAFENLKIKHNLNYYLEKYWFKNPKRSLRQRELLLYKRPFKYLQKSSLEYFNYFEELFKNFDWTLIHNGDHYFHIIAEKVAKYYWKKVLYHNSCGKFPWKMPIVHSRQNDDLENIKHLKDTISDNEQSKIKKWIEEEIEKKQLIWGKRVFIWSHHIRKFFLQYIWNYFTIGKYRKDYKSPRCLVYENLYKIYNMIFRSIRYDNINNVDKKTLFFPMHVPNDAQTTSRAYPYMDQYETAKKILDNLPTWYQLAVKEHPHGKGMINMKPFEALRKENKNLIILAPETNAYDIIQKSLAVITINSDVWYESIILGKKPFCLWKSFYSGHGYSIDIKDISKLKNIIRKNEDNIWISMEERVKLIYSLQKVHQKWVFFKNSKLEFDIDNKNIDNIFLNLKNHLNENK